MCCIIHNNESMIDCKLLELLYVHYKFVKKVRQRSWIISWFQQSERPKNAKNKCQSHVVLPPCPQHGGGAPFCVTQLMLYTGDKLSSPIFCCLSVCQVSVAPDQISTFYRTRVRSLFTLVSNWLTDSCLVNLIDVTLACEDANSKLVNVVTVADEDRVGNNLL